jgi:hypothetical protein
MVTTQVITGQAILDVLEVTQKIRMDTYNRTFCGLCQSRHGRQWYEMPKTGDRFYICKAADRMMLQGTSGDWEDIGYLDFLTYAIQRG